MRKWIGLAVATVAVVAVGATAVSKFLAAAQPAPATAKDGSPVPYGLTPEIAELLQQQDYANAVVLLQARYEEVKGDKKAAAQVRYFTGICAQKLEGAERAATIPAGAKADGSTGPGRVEHEPIKAGEVRTMAIKALGNFDYDEEKGGPIPKDVLALNGGQVRLTGYLLPLSQAQMMTEFALVPSLFSCCFGQPPGVQHIVTVHLPKGKGVEYTILEVAVEGTLRVDVRRKDEYTESIFELDARSVKVLGKGRE